MTEWVGAFALGGAAVALPEDVRKRMLAQLAHGSRREVTRGSLWLVAARGKLVEDAEAICAWEGMVAADTVDPARGPEDRPEGHYVMARFRDGRLTLVRALSGGERLYVTRVGDTVFFSASIRPLLAHPQVERTLNRDVVDEVLLTGHPVFGPQTPIAGIEEVLPGHRAELGPDGALVQHWHWADALASPEGSMDVLAKQFREALCVAVERGAGPGRPVPVALSGGIDSSAIAAAAVEVFGADNVHAFTYEFDDPTHAPPETSFAQSVAKALGIKRHDTFKIDYTEFLDAIPEHVWRSESAVHWPKAFLLPVARTIAGYGYDRYLTGFGIGSHMSYLRELARVLPWLPRRAFGMWRRVRFDAWDWLTHAAKIHPGLEPPHPRLYDVLLQLLERRGVIDDARRFYPEEMQPLLERRRGAMAALPDGVDDDTPLHVALQRQAFAQLISCVDVTRSEKASREVGVYRVSPAHFAGCIPYAYFPPEPAPPLWSRERRLRPGKALLQRAYRGVLPDEVLFRVKSWDDAVSSRAWRKRGRVFMLRALPRFPHDMDELGVGYPSAVEAWEPTSIQANCLSFWFWHELFVRRSPRRNPPTWPGLWGYDAEMLASVRRE